MSFATVTLKKGEGRLIKQGGAWIFDNEIASVMGEFQNGDVVLVRDFDGYSMGRGLINTNSKIRVRMLTRNIDQEIDDEFIKMRVIDAWEYRKSVMIKEEDLKACRIIFGDADFLPGMVVDRYENILVVQALSLGINTLKYRIIKALLDVLENDGISIRAVYERSDAKERKKEGLRTYRGLMYLDGKFYSEEEQDKPEVLNFDPHVEIVENGVHYLVDVAEGQKTGFFLDQKYNRLAMHRICKGKKVLDCFTHMGTFALNAGFAGASDVTGLDISEFAVEQATNNAKLNGLEKSVHFKAADVFDELPRLIEVGEQYDVVILDPPAFTKSKDTVKNAMKGYREINIRGLKLVKDGGYLATCSCSHFMDYENFTKVINQAAKSAHKRLKQVEYRTQAADHPILWAADESYYLKFYIFQVVDEK